MKNSHRGRPSGLPLPALKEWRRRSFPGLSLPCFYKVLQRASDEAAGHYQYPDGQIPFPALSTWKDYEKGKPASQSHLRWLLVLARWKGHESTGWSEFRDLLEVALENKKASPVHIVWEHTKPVQVSSSRDQPKCLPVVRAIRRTDEIVKRWPIVLDGKVRVETEKDVTLPGWSFPAGEAYVSPLEFCRCLGIPLFVNQRIRADGVALWPPPAGFDAHVFLVRQLCKIQKELCDWDWARRSPSSETFEILGWLTLLALRYERCATLLSERYPMRGCFHQWSRFRSIRASTLRCLENLADQSANPDLHQHAVQALKAFSVIGSDRLPASKAAAQLDAETSLFLARAVNAFEYRGGSASHAC